MITEVGRFVSPLFREYFGTVGNVDTARLMINNGMDDD